ncbi:MAG: packaged DNA stabilization protein [Desulfomicrobium sp.]
MNIPFVGPAYRSRSLPWSAQECVNLYLEAGGPGAKSEAALLGTPGMTEFATLAEAGGEVRGLWPASDGNLYAVCGDQMTKVDADGIVTSLGTLETDTGPVTMADNGVQIFAVDNPNGYVCYVSDGSFAKIPDTTESSNATWTGAVMMDYLDGYGIGITPDSNQFWITNLYDFSSMYSALDFASAEANPDKLVAVQVDHREVWLFGEKTVEVWYNSGDSSFPLSRVAGAFLEIGCAAAFSVARADNTQFWLGTNGCVVRADGYTPKIVSTRAMETAMAGYPRVDDARAFSFSQEGHTFYVITFPTADVTWVYDAATDSWHQRSSWGMGRWRANCVARFANKIIIGDATSGRLYALDPASYTEAGQPIERVRVTAPLANEDVRLNHSRVCVDFECGVGTGSGQGEDPQAMLSWSDDGGRTWSDERTASMGRQGEYRHRAIWRRLGQSRNRVYKLRITDPVRVAILGAYGDITKGRS